MSLTMYDEWFITRTEGVSYLVKVTLGERVADVVVRCVLVKTCFVDKRF